MTIRKFEFYDKLRGWKLNEVSFGNFNLLVGLSGAGKTKILNAFKSVSCAAIDKVYNDVNGCEWKLEVSNENSIYSWEAEISLNEENDRQAYFIREKIIRDGIEVVLRNEKEFIFINQALPKLKNTESAITLLRDENIILPLYKALQYFIFSVIFSDKMTEDEKIFLALENNIVAIIRDKYPTLESLKEAKIPLILKAYILQEYYPQVFESVKEQYNEIFRTSDIRIGQSLKSKPKTISYDNVFTLFIGIKEIGIPDWIIANQLSSGMIKTLFLLFELALTPSGSVIMIDDFENSMGQNCLPQLTDYILRYSNDIQFILTSHHPYVINNIPTKWWKIVTRKGSEVTVKDADSIPALKTGSKLDKFTLLMNLKEYEEGIQ